MKVMVLGAAGFIGPAVVQRLAALGHEPVAVSRHGEIQADRAHPGAIALIAREHRVDACIDLLAMTLEGTQPLLDTLAGRIGRYVLASSGDVYRQYGALHRKETVEAQSVLAEDAPLRIGRHPYRADPRRSAGDPQAWMDDYDKIPIERAALAHPELEAAVVRLPMVYGPRDRQRRFAWAIRPMRTGKDVIEVDAAWAAWRTSYGYVEDVAQGLALAAVHPAAAGRTYNVGALEAPDHAAWAARFAEAIGWRGEVRRVARGAVAQPLRGVLDGLDLSIPLVTDTGRIRAELGYAEVVEPDEALRLTVGDEVSRAA